MNTAMERDLLLCAQTPVVTENRRCLLAAVPRELGGFGFGRGDIAERLNGLEQRAGPYAASIKTHLCWTGIAAELWRSGDRSLEWVLRHAARGAVFHGSSYDELVRPRAEARQVRGGYHFQPLPPLDVPLRTWTYVSAFGFDDDAATPPTLVHAFIPRDTYENGFAQHRYVVRMVEPQEVQRDIFLAVALHWFSALR